MSTNMPENTSMEQIRELLMGTQMKDMENRSLRLEERFLQEIADLRESMKNRLDSLENFMKSESSSLLHRLQEEKTERTTALKAEQRERADALKAERKERLEALKQEKREREDATAKLAGELAKMDESFERKLASLSASLDTAEQELRQLLLTESSRLSESGEEKYKDALTALARTKAQLESDLVSRSALSATFTEFALKMAGEISLADGGGQPATAGKTAGGKPVEA